MPLVQGQRDGATFYLVRALYAHLVSGDELLAHVYIGRALWTIGASDERPSLPSDIRLPRKGENPAKL